MAQRIPPSKSLQRTVLSGRRGAQRFDSIGWHVSFRLRVREDELAIWARRYSYPGDGAIEARVKPARIRGHLLRGEFLALCRWKTPRSQPHCRRNHDDYIRQVTRIALSTTNEELKIRVLLLLDGVSWPTASVILHFCDRGKYPILDVRALWSVGLRRVPAYSFMLWLGYTRFIRGISSRTGLSMRTIDRALWQYSKERQP